MTNQQHPLTPPPELVQELYGLPQMMVIEKAFQAGADQELDACCEWLRSSGHPPLTISVLCAGRRPKTQSLKQQALDQLDFIEDRYGHLNTDYIRRALDRIQELEDQHNK